MKKPTQRTSPQQPGGRYVTVTPAAALSIAALTSNNEQPLGIAACSFAISLDQPWQQILPAHDFAAKDGRPFEVPGNKWRINDEIGPTLAAALNARAQAGQDLLFDYEHQTLLTKDNGKDAPASGWGKAFEWRPGSGLFAKLKYTPKAKQQVQDEEYRFFSPVVLYDKKTGEVRDLHSVALTNDPAVLGMQAAAALNSRFNQPQEKPMNKALALLLSLIGEDVDTSKDIDAAALKAKLESESTEQALAALKAKVESNNEQTTQIAALKADLAKAKDSKVDMGQYVPRETYDAVITEMAALKAGNESLSVDQVIQQAKDDGKFIAEAEIPYLQGLGQTNLAALKATLDKRQSLAALKSQKQVSGEDNHRQDKTGVAALTTDQKLVADQLGISHEDYAKELEGDQAK